MRPRSLLKVVMLCGLLMAATAVASSSAVAKPKVKTHGSCHQPFETGRTTLTFESGGLERVVELFVPSSYDGRHRLPVVLNLHASQENANDQMLISELEETADRKGFIVAAAQGAIVNEFIPGRPGFLWNVPGFPLPVEGGPGEEPPDDEQFLVDTIDQLQQDLCVDSRRVYGTGYSGGARMISQFACDVAEHVAAIAPVGGLRAGPPISEPEPHPDPNRCNPSRGVPIVTFHGEQDPLNTYLDGGLASWQYGMPKAMARWAELNRCHVGPRERDVTQNVSRISYFGCQKNARIVLYLAADAGHTWPGSSTCEPNPDICGPGATNHEISANELMWRFMSKYRLPKEKH